MEPEKNYAGREGELEPYTVFAGHYDRIMAHVPYSRWAAYLLDRYRLVRGQKPESVFDLGCGTGTLLFELGRLGEITELVGLDRSSEMLDRCKKNFPGISVICGDFDEDLPMDSGSQNWIISSHDSINYLTTEDSLLRHFQSVQRVLRSGGVYSLDATTRYNILVNFNNRTIREKMGQSSLEWANTFDANTEILRSDLLFKNLESDEEFREVHLQKFYSVEVIRNLAEEAGLEFQLLEGDYRRRKPGKTDTMWNFHFLKRKV